MHKMIPVTRAQMEACSRALPKRNYRCPFCGTRYDHDGGYGHSVRTCQERERTAGKPVKGG